MNEKGKISFWYSWPVIILALCVFWPIGVCLIIKRVSVDKRTAMGAGKLIGILGILSYCVAVISLINCFSGGFSSNDLTGIIFFAIAGFALRWLAKKLKKDAEEVKKYLSIIVNGNERSIQTIASSVGKSYDASRADIQKMIDKGYLRNAYINDGTGEVVLPNAAPQKAAAPNVNSAPASNTVNVTTRVVACPCCGANNTITGNIGECEYCGSALSAN